MVSSKYYVYGGGRWRELDSKTGRVNGWRGARLCVARRGRLFVQRGAARSRLLAALRALAAGHPTAARLGPRLPRIPGKSRATCSRDRDRSGARSRSHCRCCCHHNNNNNRCVNKSVRSQRSMTSDACIQTAPPGPARRPRLAFPPPAPRALPPTAAVRTGPSPRQTRSTSTPIERDKAASRRGSSSTSWKKDNESSSDSEVLAPKTNISPTKSNTSSAKKTNLSLKRKRQLSNSETTESSKDEISISQSILKKDFNAKYLRPRTSLRATGPAGVRAPQIRTRVVPGRAITVSSDDENKDPTVNFTSLVIHDTETEEEAPKRDKSIDLFTQKSQTDMYRELVISEHDVEILRRFMLKHDPKFDLYRYDDDDGYKARFFYSINPLVSIDRCPRIARMLKDREGLSLRHFASQLGLRSVSEGESSPGRGAPPRRLRRRANVGSSQEEETPDSEDKENLETTATVRRRSERHTASVGGGGGGGGGGDRRKLEGRRDRDDGTEMTELTVNIERLKEKSDETNRKPPQRRRTGPSPRHNVHEKHRDSDRLKRKHDDSVEAIKLDDERRKRQKKLHKHEETDGEEQTRLDNKKNNVASRDRTKEAVVNEKAKGGGGGGSWGVDPVDTWRRKEYTALEDHAIVEWISGGERARLVNGNRVWRSLEQVFEGVAGQFRSWHSLRNRYLRYLLPALPRLQLAPGTQARLRAAAARGERKYKRSPRRNSIFGEPARGASSRRPQPPPSPPASAPAPGPARDAKESESSASEEAAPPPRPRPRTPRYSEVTRQFAARHPAPPSSSSSEFEGPKTPRLRPRTQTPVTRSTGAGRSPLTRASGLRPRIRKLYNPNEL